MKRTTNTLLTAALLGSAGLAQAASEDVTITSTDALGGKTDIVVTVHKPDAQGPFPVVLHSHGWSGSRTTDPADFARYLDSGFAVISIDQRGHGDSGGAANVEDPDFEGHDVMAIVDYVADQDWSLKNEEEDAVTENDPVLFSIGGSYGGGYQWAGVLTEMNVRYDGKTRFDAIAPQITWHNLVQSLAPNGVARSVYLTGLYGVKTAQGPQTLAEYIHPAYAYTMSTGNIPDGTVPGFVNFEEEFLRHGPAGYDKNDVNIPALMRQGMTDILFNTNQGYRNFSEILTEKARKKSIFVGYNGGHVALSPMGLPPGSNPSGDPCSEQLMGGGDFTDMTVAFFLFVMNDDNPRNEIVGKGKLPYHVATDTNTCVSTASLEPNTPFSVATIEIPGAGAGVGTPAGAGIPLFTAIPGTENGITVAGIPKLTGTVSAGSAEARAFLGLAKGTNESNAVLIQNSVMPIRFPTPVTGEAFEVELGGIAATLEPGEKLFLMTSALNDQFIAHGSRVPGAIVITGATIELPVQ